MNDEISLDFGDNEQAIWLHLAEDDPDGGTWMSMDRAAYVAGLLTAAVAAVKTSKEGD